MHPQPGNLDTPLRPDITLTGSKLLDLFNAQMVSRHLDLAARELRSRDAGYYTIGSTGHEGNAVLGDLVRCTDPAYLHYRSGALFVQRSKQRDPTHVVRDVLLGIVASATDPISGGRHKVWGSKDLWVLPQTSTISSHIPKAVGAAVSIRRAKRRGWPMPIPEDSIVLCSFGDASINHATALAGFNAARWLAYQNLPVPILFVCEDNHWGISVRTPTGWIEHGAGRQPGWTYFHASGLDIIQAYEVTKQAVEHCRHLRMPVFLHLDVVRLLGHAGSDVELNYRPLREVEQGEAQDPVLRTAKLVFDYRLMSPGEILAAYDAIANHVSSEAAWAEAQPQLESAAEVMQPLAPYHPDRVRAEAERIVDDANREQAYQDLGGVPENTAPRHMAVLINLALREMMAKYPESLLFGEDVAKKGGVYHVTAGLSDQFGLGRVFNTLLDEQNILGMAQGAGHLGILAIPEIQYLAYFHNASDQIRGEAASMQFFSRDQFRNPMVVRIAAFGYQKGFGGHFHSDNTLAPLRDIPGIIIAAPARGDDAVAMLRTSCALAQIDGRVVIFLEPIARYMTRDLLQPKDGAWLNRYPRQGSAAAFGEGRVYHADAQDLTIISFANGVYLSLRAAARLAREHNIAARVLDLRWLQPLNATLIAQQALATGKVLVVDETRHSGGVSEGIVAALVDHDCGHLPIQRLNAADSFVPLGPAAQTVLPSEDAIVAAAIRLALSTAPHK